jgi:glycerol 3-phosphatase-1
MLGVDKPSEKVVVFEDASAGVKAGKAADATVIAVIETHSREALEQAGADYILDGLSTVGLTGHCGGTMRLKF